MPPCLSFFISVLPRTYRTPYWVPGGKEGLREEIRMSLVSLVLPDLISLISYSLHHHLVTQAVIQPLEHANILPTIEAGLGQSSTFFTWQIHLRERVLPSISSLKNSAPSLFSSSSLCIISNNHFVVNVFSPIGTRTGDIYVLSNFFWIPKA